MQDKIRFESTTSFLGRNGCFKCRGFAFVHYKEFYREKNSQLYDECVRVYPVNSRGEEASCFIEIPKSEIDNFVRVLKQAANKE